MRSQRIKQLQRLTLVQGGVGLESNGYVCTIYGCESHASTTLPLISKEAQLSELLSDLERQVETLEYKYLEACAILSTAMARLAELKLIKIDTTITK